MTRKKWLQLGILIGIVYLFMRFISPFASPFLISFLVVKGMQPILNILHKYTRIPKTILGIFLVLLLMGTLIFLLWIFGYYLYHGDYLWITCLPEYLGEYSELWVLCCNRIIPVVMDQSYHCIKGIGGVLSFLAVTLIATFLLLKDYDVLMHTFQTNSGFKRIREIGGKIIYYLKTFLRAQIIILVTISGICAVTLRVIGMPDGVWYGILTGIMDMLPFIGTGIMLVPLAVYYFLAKEYLFAIVCICLYGCCALTRELLEPKLIGKKVGILAVGILFALFSGIYLFGISGIIKGPLSLVIICETCKYLWYTERDEDKGVSST